MRMGDSGSLPGDVFAIKELGVAWWQRNYFWPMSDTAHMGMLDALWRHFDALFESVRVDEQDLLLSDTNFVGFLAQHLHACAVKTYCEREGVKLVSTSLSLAFYEPNWIGLSNRFAWDRSLLDVGKAQIKRLLKRIRFNRHLPVHRNLAGLFSKAHTWGLGSLSALKEDYLAQKHIYCDHHYAETLLPRRTDGETGGLTPQLQAGIKAFLDKVHGYCESELSFGFDRASAGRCWTRRLAFFDSVYRTVMQRKAIPDAILLTEVAKPMNKIIALAMKRRGTKVIGFHHGNDMCNSWERATPYIENSHCDTFVCPTTRSAEFHAKENALAGISRLRNTVFVSAETARYRRLRERCSEDSFPEKFKTVMIIGYPMNAHRYPYSVGNFFLFQLDLELRLAQLLKRRGYQVIYKIHPERTKEASGIFEGTVDRILPQPLESVYQQTDAFLFGCIASSTFGFTVCTNKPIFVIDIEGKDWNPEAYELLRRRCVMVPAHYDERNRLEFDEGYLLDKLGRRPEPPDFSYFEEVMVPSRSSSER